MARIQKAPLLRVTLRDSRVSHHLQHRWLMSQTEFQVLHFWFNSQTMHLGRQKIAQKFGPQLFLWEAKMRFLALVFHSIAVNWKCE